MADFERALNKLITDAYFREAVIEDWAKLTQEFGGLTGEELLLLMQVWNATTDEDKVLAITLCHCCCSTEVARG
jgi:hypothetical protein